LRLDIYNSAMSSPASFDHVATAAALSSSSIRVRIPYLQGLEERITQRGVFLSMLLGSKQRSLPSYEFLNTDALWI
jgi:phospholipid N-methyltransferase